MRSHESSICIVQSTLEGDVCVHENNEELTDDDHKIEISLTSIATSSVITMVVSVIATLSSFVGAVIVTTGGFVSIIYDCEFLPCAHKALSSANTSIVPDAATLFIIQVTGFK